MRVVKGNARFTVMREGVIRIEYAREGAFLDGGTFFARRASFCDADVSDGDGLVIRTPKMTLRYSGGEFSAETLTVEVHTGGVGAVWKYSDGSKNNLGGTLKTLDGVSGAVPLPDGILSRDGFYVYDDSGKAVIEGDRASSRDPRHERDLYFFAYGNDYRAALSDLAAVSGDFMLPRKYFFGSWYSRWHAFSADEYLDIVDGYDYNGFPIDVMVIDMDWHYHDWDRGGRGHTSDFGFGHAGGNLGWTGYSWVTERFPDPEGFLASLHKNGVAAVLNDHPADGVRSNEEHYPEFLSMLKEAGYTERVPCPDRPCRDQSSDGKENFRFNAGDPDYMRAFFEAAHRPREREGVDFWWLDWQQDYIYPEVNGVRGLSHLEWLNTLYYRDSERDGKRGQNFSRWAGVGDQRHPGFFSGDAETSFETLDFEVAMTVSAGNAGCFFWSHDIGGFHDGATPKQAECFARWMQFGAMSAAMRVHSCGEDTDRRPWLWGEPFSSAMREAARLRSRLFPYIYSSAYYSAKNATPLLCPLYFDEPEKEESYRYPTTYMLGDALLVSPVTTPGEGERFTANKTFYVPRGVFYGVFDGKRYTEGETTLSCDIFTFPLLARAGAPVVTRPYTGRMTTPTGALVVHIFADAEATGGDALLYEDDGISKVGECFRETEVCYRRDGARHTLTLIPRGDGYEGEPLRRDVTLVLHGVEDGECDSYDKSRRIATVTKRGVTPSDEVTIEYKEKTC